MKFEDLRKLVDIPACRPGARHSPRECAQITRILYLFANILERAELSKKKRSLYGERYQAADLKDEMKLVSEFEIL